jgi:hypothetical protein
MTLSFPPGHQRRDSIGCLIAATLLMGLLVAIIASVIKP